MLATRRRDRRVYKGTGLPPSPLRWPLRWISELPADKFNALVDRAVQDLVPTMDIQNFGNCGTMYISVDEKSADKDKDGKAGAIHLIRDLGRIARENCANKSGPDTTLPAGHAQQTIVYPAGFWK